MHATEEFWNDKFQNEQYFYGEEPNVFLKENYQVFKEGGKILSLGEGEGRNAIFLATNNLEVTAVDASSKGLEKLSKLAEKFNVKINNRYEDVVKGEWDTLNLDGIINIYCHLPSQDRIKLYEKIKKSLNKGGIFLTEMFSVEQLGLTSGGPANLDMLLTIEEFKNEFSDFKIIYAKAETIELDEGRHLGEAKVIRFIAQK